MNKKNLQIIMIILAIALFGAAVFLLSRATTNNAAEFPDMPFAFTQIEFPHFADNVCDISTYGAVADEKTLNTQAFQKAVEDCSQKGGGKVVVPSGTWLTGAIHLKSKINLHLNDGAIVTFSSDPNDYLPTVFTRIEGMELYNYSPLIYALDATDIAITGKGQFDGQGQEWASWKKNEKKAFQKLDSLVKKNVAPRERLFGDVEFGIRPSFVQFVNCKNVWLEDFKITDSPRWTIHPVYTDGIVIKNITVETDTFNSDGIVIDSSRNVLIENSTLTTGDDSIAIKSGLNQDGFRVARPSENIVIRNCIILEGHSGIAIGSEMSGNVRNVFLQNLQLSGVDQGIRAKSLLGRGGIVENIWVKDVRIISATNTGFMLDLTYPASTLKPSGKEAPIFRNFHVDNLVIEQTKKAIILDGIKQSMISNVNFSNLEATSTEGVKINFSKEVSFQDCKFKTTSGGQTFNLKNSTDIKGAK